MFAVEAFPATELGNASFLIADAEHGVGLVVDPYRDVDGYLTRASSLGIKLTHALDTHLHNDFASGRGELAAEAGTAKLSGWVCTSAMNEKNETAMHRMARIRNFRWAIMASNRSNPRAPTVGQGQVPNRRRPVGVCGLHEREGQVPDPGPVRDGHERLVGKPAGNVMTGGDAACHQIL